ncbi:MAG: cytochrome oxidase [Candidatus Bostrichicola ureolyticus]|nr:MAG: cytochrome oxidase [Candidatus Bostrichicola ureolyticus]WGH27506.1 MAG: cytochrome oxidase [Candidatus Bostrichicola ureolyticus]
MIVFFKQYLSKNYIFIIIQSIILLIFFLIFCLIIYLVYKKPKIYYKGISNIPLDKN